MNIAIIGVGEVGGCYARALAGRADLWLCDVKREGPPAETAAALGLQLVGAPDAGLADADVVLVCTPGGECAGVAAAVLPHLGPASFYLEMSTARPDDLKQAAAMFRAAGRDFVDIAIMSSIQLAGARTPLLMAGDRLDAARALFEDLGAPVRLVEGNAAAGDATALKLLRSVLIKGLECLAVEALTAAEAMGVRGQLMAVLQDLDETRFADFAEMMVTTHAPHAARRGHEMVEAAEQLRAMGYDGLITSALPARFEKTVAAKAKYPGADRVRGMAEALAWLDRALRD